jgi:uncharacterized protein YecE (DUF72 family)
MQLVIGCAIWAYKGWVGDLFPPGSRSADFLHLYSQRFATVEGNTTFYSIPDTATLQRWTAATPDTFQFCLKLPRSLTHSGPLVPHLASTLQFIQAMAALGPRLGPFLAQLPPSYAPNQLQDLATFLTALPRDRHDFALEVRHRDWFRPDAARTLNRLLEQLGIARVLLDTRPIYDYNDALTPGPTAEPSPTAAIACKKPRLPLQPVVTAPFSLIRYVSHPDRDINLPYMQAWAETLAPWLHHGTRLYLFVHCPVEARSPTNARLFQTQLERHGLTIPPLPWNQRPDHTLTHPLASQPPPAIAAPQIPTVTQLNLFS